MDLRQMIKTKQKEYNDLQQQLQTKKEELTKINEIKMIYNIGGKQP